MFLFGGFLQGFVRNPVRRRWYGPECLEQYKENLHKFFSQIKALVGRDCLMLWTLAMPLAKKIKGGFLVSEVSHLAPSLCYDLIEANFYCSQLADAYGLDVLDLHFHFRFSLQHRMPDGVHWDALAHRRISSLLLGHAADAWGDHSRDMAPSDTNRVTAQTHFSIFQLTQVEQSTCSIMHIRLVTTSKVGKVHPCSVCSTVSRTQLLLESAALPLYFLCSIMLILTKVFLMLDSTVSVDPLPPANPWLSQRVHPQARAPWSQDDSMLSPGGGLKFLPPSRQDDHCMRRGRPNFRSHPYPPILPRVTPRHPTYGW
ncbi:hypothetical protein JOQ06_001610 [Pogonophryne albipinna]|uniref:Uncharacterized protein n=1 Tax=Pogonophryne albipinna TaxID=1090488 RepID=A0AAD6B695_9TELE|nr:hypothetical protein JOQ06_001610 [Pogonophryne albipinna]